MEYTGVDRAERSREDVWAESGVVCSMSERMGDCGWWAEASPGPSPEPSPEPRPVEQKPAASEDLCSVVPDR